MAIVLHADAILSVVLNCARCEHRYNVCFTALPILFLAMFDNGGLSAATLENSPRLYLSLSSGGLFSDRKFLKWLLLGVWHAAFCFFMTYVTVAKDDVSGADGKNKGLYFNSTVNYTAIVWLATVRILLEAGSINAIFGFIVCMSFIIYIPVVVFASHLQLVNPQLYHVADVLFADPFVWLVLLFCVLFPCLVDATLIAVQREFTPKLLDVLMERDSMTPEELRRAGIAASIDDEYGLSATRARRRQAHWLTQQQKEDLLLQKIRSALKQAKEDAANDNASASAKDDAQKRAEALVYTMTRLQHLSGANFDGSSGSFLTLFDLTEAPTAAELAAIKDREAKAAEEAQKQHELDRLRRDAEARREDELQRARETARQERELQPAQKRGGARKATDSVGEDAVVLQLQLDEDSTSDVLEMHDSELGTGSGRTHHAPLHSLGEHAHHRLVEEEEDDEANLSFEPL